MKITDIRCYLIEDDYPPVPFRWRKGLPGSGDGTRPPDKPKAAILRMDTDEGFSGAVRVGDGETVASLTRRRFKSLVGEDPLLTETLWTRMWEIDRIEEMQMLHLGLIDLLAWDVKSKKAGLPVYQMLGGGDPRVQAYASTVTWNTMEEYERHIKECRDEGFTAFKLHAWATQRKTRASAAICGAGPAKRRP
jgi:L-alanine-DL-glutamate epimerase-like enolase superfamily enzyme